MDLTASLQKMMELEERLLEKLDAPSFAVILPSHTTFLRFLHQRVSDERISKMLQLDGENSNARVVPAQQVLNEVIKHGSAKQGHGCEALLRVEQLVVPNKKLNTIESVKKDSTVRLAPFSRGRLFSQK